MAVKIFIVQAPRVFVRLDWKNLANDKHSSLLQKYVIYGQKKVL